MTREYEGQFAKLLSMGIVQTVVVSIADSAGSCLQNCQRMRASRRGPARLGRVRVAVGRAEEFIFLLLEN
jgi:hypothetical protein